MDNSYQPLDYFTTVDPISNDGQSETIPNDDQFFLMYFIMGTYFGPDLKGERPQKSALQRMYENLPQYSPEQLGGSHMKSIEVERIYYHVLRNANQSVSVKLPILQQFFLGTLRIAHVTYPQFPDLFPFQLHPHSRSNGFKVIENLCFINDPDIFSLNPDDVARFKKLSRYENFHLNKDEARSYTSSNGGGLYNINVQNTEYNGGSHSFKASKKTRRVDDIMGNAGLYPFEDVHVVAPISSVSRNGVPMKFNFVDSYGAQAGNGGVEDPGPAMVFFPSKPKKYELDNILAVAKNGVVLTGSAAKGNMGPVIGLVDILESEESYIFRVSLPGVKRDGREFSCEVEGDGKVMIKGVTTTGEKKVYRHNQVFEMLTQNLCSPGNFSISFYLPGPVDPLQFSDDFGTYGVFEGIVAKDKSIEQ